MSAAMSANVGSIDRAIRIILGLGLVVLPFILSWSASAMAVSVVVGLVLVVTALVRFCPLYRLIGVRTCRV
jgi:hypothetical protein